MQGKRNQTRTPRETALIVLERLKAIWTQRVPLLAYNTPFELLCAVILSAQCTDAMVNRITPLLFARWPDSGTLSRADTAEVETIIRPTGFYRTKAFHLVQTAIIIQEIHGGVVPEGMDALTSLPGVGRKTANVVRSAIFGQPAIIVDTHFIRVSNRLGLVDEKDPEKIEKAIGKMVPQGEWTAFSHAVNRHGRVVCTARSPHCGECPVADLCSFLMRSEQGFGKKQKKPSHAGG